MFKASRLIFFVIVGGIVCEYHVNRCTFCRPEFKTTVSLKVWNILYQHIPAWIIATWKSSAPMTAVSFMTVTLVLIDWGSSEVMRDTPISPIYKVNIPVMAMRCAHPSVCYDSLTHWGQDKMAANFLTAWHRPGNKPLFGPMVVNLLPHICATRPQWVKRSNKCVASGRVKWHFSM